MFLVDAKDDKIIPLQNLHEVFALLNLQLVMQIVHCTYSGSW